VKEEKKYLKEKRLRCKEKDVDDTDMLVVNLKRFFYSKI